VIVSDYVSHSEICTLHEIQKIIQEWLQHTRDHVNYIKKTQKKKSIKLYIVLDMLNITIKKNCLNLFSLMRKIII